MPRKTKATFNLHAEVVEKLNGLRRWKRLALWKEAVKDPLFTKDIEDVESDFRYADAETGNDTRFTSPPRAVRWRRRRTGSRIPS